MAEEIVTSPEESVSMEAPIVEAPVDVQEDVVDIEPAPIANAKGVENFKKLHKILAADEVYSQITPADFNQFLSKYSDITKLQKLHKILAADEVYGQIMPSDINVAAEKYGFGGLGKPSAVPSASVGGGSATKGRGVEQPSTLQPRKPSEVEEITNAYGWDTTLRDKLPTYLTPEELESGARAEAKLPSEGISNVERRQQIDENERVVKRARYEDQFQAIEQAARDTADQEAGLEQNPLERVKNSFARGSATLLSSLYRSPAFVLDMLYVPQNYIADKYDIPSLKATGKEALGFLYDDKNPFSLESSAQELDKYVERSQKRFQAKYEESLTKAISNGNYLDAVGILSNQIAESAPVTLSLMMGNAAGLSATGSTIAGGVVFGAGKKEELDKNNPNMTEAQKATTAFLSGLTEGFFEQYGISKLGGITKRILEKSGADVARKFAEEGFKKMYGKAFVRYLGVSSEESLGETATQFAQNVIDKYSGAKPNLDLRDGLVDSFVGGFGQTTAYSAIPGAITVAKTIRGKKKQQEIQQQREELSAIALSEEVPDASKRALGDKIKDLNEEEANLVNADNELYNSLSEEGKSKLTTLTNDAEQIEVTLQNPNLPDEARVILEEKLNSINGELESIQAPAESKVKTLEEEINIGDTVDLTPLVESSKAKVEIQADNISKEDNDKWTSIIDQSTSPRELDKIIDSIDADGQMTPELITAINTKRESLSPQPTPTVEAAPVAETQKIEIPKYFTFKELGGAKGKSGKALSSVEADKNEEIAQQLKDTLKEGDKLIEPNGTVTYFRDGKVVKEDGSPYGMVDIPAFINGVTIERGEAQAPVAEAAKVEAEQVITLPPEIDSLDDNEIVSIKYETFDEIPESLKSKANKFGGKDVKYRKSILGIPVGKEFTSKTKEGYVVTALGSEIKDAARQTLSSQAQVSPTSEQAPESFPAQEGATAEQEQEFKAHPELEQVYRDLHAAVNKNIDPKTLDAVKRNPTLVMVEKALRELERKGIINIDCK